MAICIDGNTFYLSRERLALPASNAHCKDKVPILQNWQQEGSNQRPISYGRFAIKTGAIAS
jgi:hypothetical protein